MTVEQIEVLARAGTAIAQNPYITDKRVQLTLDGDCLRIVGNVSSYFQKQMVQEALRPIIASLRIENDLIVN